MRAAFALRIISGKIIYNFAFVALCGALQTPFHGRGRNGKQHLQRRFLRKRGAAGNESTQAHCVRQLPLRGKTSPAPGEDVAQRQKGESGTAQAVTERGSPFLRKKSQDLARQAG